MERSFATEDESLFDASKLPPGEAIELDFPANFKQRLYRAGQLLADRHLGDGATFLFELSSCYKDEGIYF